MKILTTDKAPSWISVECDWSDWRFKLRNYRCDYNYSLFNFTESKELKIRKMGALYIGPFFIFYGNGDSQWVSK